MTPCTCPNIPHTDACQTASLNALVERRGYMQRDDWFSPHALGRRGDGDEEWASDRDADFAADRYYAPREPS